MKKFLYLIFLMLLCSCGKTSDNNTQKDIKIPKEIMGITIGKTSKDQAIQTLQEQGYYVIRLNSKIFGSIGNIYYGGITWECLAVAVDDNKVRAIKFIKNIKNSKQLEEFDTISKVLMDKYQSLYIPGDPIIFEIGEDESEPTEYLFQDHNISLEFGQDLNKKRELILKLFYYETKYRDSFNKSVYEDL